MLAEKLVQAIERAAKESVFPRERARIIRMYTRAVAKPILDVPYREGAIGAIIGIEKGALARDQRGVAKRGCGSGRDAMPAMTGPDPGPVVHTYILYIPVGAQRSSFPRGPLARGSP